MESRVNRTAASSFESPVFDQALLETLPVAIYVCDLDGKLTRYNRRAAALWGREPALQGPDQDRLGSARFFRPDGTYGDDSPMAAILRGGEPVDGSETVIERPDGAQLTCLIDIAPLRNVHGDVIGAVGILQEKQALQDLNATIEQRVEAVRREMTAIFAKLHESEHRFRLLVESVRDYAIFMLDPDGFVTNWNSGAERIKGYTADEIIGQHFSRFYGEEDRAKGVPQRALAAARRTGTYESEGRRVRKDGSVFWASVALNAIYDETGTFAGFAKVTRDLTEKRAAEERLRQAQKMEAIGQLTGGVAHDFNNLLTAIVGNLELLTTILPSTEQRAQRYAAAALRAAARGSRLTDHLLAFSRRQEIRPEIVGVNRLIRDIGILCQGIVGDGVQLELRLQDDLWMCHVDAGQLEAAVLNISANARDAMSGSGRLTIATGNVTIAVADAIDLDAGDYVVLSLTDTGCGMSETVLSQAFEPFYTTKEVGKGTGLGLSQVYGFAKQSGGAVRIESQMGVGTTVRIYLPRSEGKAANNASAEDHDGNVPGGNATILVVDDDADVREMTVDLLAELGYRTLVATNGPEALAILHRDKHVDLLFSDVVMPEGMSGIELARTARRLRPDIKILLSSGHPGDTRSQPARPEFPFIAKPYRPSTLSKQIQNMLATDIT